MQAKVSITEHRPSLKIMELGSGSTQLRDLHPRGDKIRGGEANSDTTADCWALTYLSVLSWDSDSLQLLIKWARFLWQIIKPAKRVQRSSGGNGSLWASNLTSLCLNHLFCKMRNILTLVPRALVIRQVLTLVKWVAHDCTWRCSVMLAPDGHSTPGRHTLFHTHVARPHGIAKKHRNPRVLWARNNLRNCVSLRRVALCLTHCLVHAQKISLIYGLRDCPSNWMNFTFFWAMWPSVCILGHLTLLQLGWCCCLQAYGGSTVCCSFHHSLLSFGIQPGMGCYFISKNFVFH